MHNNITNIYLGIRTLILCYNGDQGWAARYVHKCLCVCVYLMSECVCDANEKSSYSVRQGCVPGVFTQR